MIPLVSVVIRTYNRAHMIERAVYSVLNQTFGDFEVVVSDDGSTDNTKEIIDKLKEKDKRIRFFSQPHGGRPGRTANLGIRNCRTNFIAFLDSDDEWLPTKLQKQYEFIKNTGPETGFVICDTILINPDGSQVQKIIDESESFHTSILLKGYLSPSSMLAKKEVFEKIGPIDENCLIYDDWDMFIKISRHFGFNFINEPLYKYYIHEGNISYNKNYCRHAHDLEYLINKHYPVLVEHPEILEHHYKTLVKYLVSTGDRKKAKYYLKKNVNLRPSLKNMVILALAYFGKY